MLALILFDLDHFKKVNDTYGHPAGDETLREFAKVLRSSARDQDVVARFGGEEFVMLIAGNSIQAARVVASRVVDRVRERISPLKARSSDWLEVMDIAHRLGLSSSATMMFGHVETIEDRIEHLDRIRVQQDSSKGFTAFIGWTFQAENTRLKAPAAGADDYLRTQALARIYLDNFPSVQSSWVTQGLEIGQVALKFGANDLGSIMIEENVVSQAGTTFKMTVPDMHRLIADLGYEPHQRDNWYHLLN